MLTAILTLFALALVAPPLCRWGGPRGGRWAAWLLALVPAGWLVVFARQVPAVAAGEVVRQSFRWVPELGMALSFSLDGLSLLFALLVTGMGTLVVLYAGGYLPTAAKRARFLGALFAFMGSMLGLVLADNLLLLFLFWEATSVTSYLLIGFYHHTEAARKAALQALLVTALGGLALLAGFLLLGLAAGSFELSELTAPGRGLQGHPLYGALLTLILVGAFTKSAQFPFHFWLPNAMAAPAPASAYLHSSTMVKAGIYLLARLEPTLGGTGAWAGALLAAGGVTMILGAVLAVRQTDLKRTLAFGTVSALGSLTFFLGLGTPAALKAAMVFLLAHALYKGALFLVVGAVDHAAGSRDPRSLGGLGRVMPVTAAAGAVAALSMGGFPPFFGFLSKESVLEAALGGPHGFLLEVLTVVAGALIVTVGLLAGWRPFFRRRGAAPAPDAREAPVEMLAGPVVLGALSLTFGLVPAMVGRWLIAPAAAASAGTAVPVKLALWHGVTTPLLVGLGMLAAGTLLYLAWDRVHRWGGAAARWLEAAPTRAYESALDGLLAAAATGTRWLQAAPLSRHVRIVVAVVTTLVGTAVLSLLELPLPGSWSGIRPLEVVLAAVLVVATGVAVASPSRLTAVVALGVVGFGIALLFLYYGAPDLAMTQFAVETLTVVLVVLAFVHLPRLRRLSSRRRRLLDALLAAAGGAVMSALVLLATQVELAGRISEYFAAESVPSGFGRNVVNVILVDFRALDTLGEITVLAVASLGAVALLKLKGKREKGS